jgi:hypothetical protein
MIVSIIVILVTPNMINAMPPGAYYVYTHTIIDTSIHHILHIHTNNAYYYDTYTIYNILLHIHTYIHTYTHITYIHTHIHTHTYIHTYTGSVTVDLAAASGGNVETTVPGM